MGEKLTDEEAEKMIKEVDVDDAQQSRSSMWLTGGMSQRERIVVRTVEVEQIITQEVQQSKTSRKAWRFIKCSRGKCRRCGFRTCCTKQQVRHPADCAKSTPTQTVQKAEEAPHVQIIDRVEEIPEICCRCQRHKRHGKLWKFAEK